LQLRGLSASLTNGSGGSQGSHPPGFFFQGATSMSLFDQVKEMHEQFNIAGGDYYNPLQDDEKKFRATGIQEELIEYLLAKSATEQLDALIDLIIFAVSLAERHGFQQFDAAFRRVMKTNCEKQLGANSKRGSFEIDLVKPDGWKPANLADLINFRPYRRFAEQRKSSSVDLSKYESPRQTTHWEKTNE